MTGTRAQRIGLAALAGIGLLALAGWLAQDLLLGKPVEALAVTQQDLVQTLDAPGSVSQPERLPLAPPVSGLVARVLVKAGDHVESGAVLIELDAKEALAVVEQARAEAAQAEARMRGAREVRVPPPSAPPSAQVQAQVEQARRQVERTRALRDKGFMSDAALNNALRSLEAAEQQLRSAEAQGSAARPNANAEEAAARTALMQARSTMQAAQARADDALIRSPAAGTVLSVNVQRGGAVIAGREMLVLAPDGDAEIAVRVAAARAKAVRVGQKAVVTMTPGAPPSGAAGPPVNQPASADAAARKDADKTTGKAEAKAEAKPAEKAMPPDATKDAAAPPPATATPQRFRAEVVWIDEGADAAQQQTELRLAPEAGVTLHADAKLAVNIELARRPDVLVAPLAAIREPDSAKPWVLIIVEGRAERRSVTLGLRSATHAEIVDGLAVGALLVPASAPVSEGDKVRVVAGAAVAAPAAGSPGVAPGSAAK